MDLFEQRLRDIQELKEDEIKKLRRTKLYTKEDFDRANCSIQYFALGLVLGAIIMTIILHYY